MTVELDSASQATPGANTFSESDYTANLGKVIAHAAATGTAVVVDAAGLPIVVITTSPVEPAPLDTRAGSAEPACPTAASPNALGRLQSHLDNEQ